MSLPRRDVRFYLDASMHEALTAICNQRGITLGDFVESVVVREIEHIAHEAIELAAALRGVRNVTESAGVAVQHMSEAERIRAGKPPGAVR